jgi:hypothetical protein
MPNALLAVYRVRAGTRRRAYAHVAHDLWVEAEDAPNDARERLRMLMTAVPAGSAVSHETAVWCYGLPTNRRWDRARFHITVPPDRSSTRKDFVVHQAVLPFDDLAVFEAIQLTAPARTLLDLAARGDRERLVVVGDAVLRAGLARPEDLRARLARARGARGVRLARAVVPLLTDKAQSPPESIIRLRFHDAGLPTPVAQCPILLDRFLAHADLGFPGAKVAVEYDGRRHADDLGRDIDRYAAFAAAGWMLIRAGANDLRFGSRLLIDRTRAALRGRGIDC